MNCAICDQPIVGNIVRYNDITLGVLGRYHHAVIIELLSSQLAQVRWPWGAESTEWIPNLHTQD